MRAGLLRTNYAAVRQAIAAHLTALSKKAQELAAREGGEVMAHDQPYQVDGEVAAMCAVSALSRSVNDGPGMSEFPVCTTLSHAIRLEDLERGRSISVRYAS